MAKWNMRNEIWTLKQRLNGIDDPLAVYRLMNKVKEKELGWGIAEALYEGQIKVQVSQKKAGNVNLNIEDGYSGGLKESQKLLKSARSDISDCVQAIENRFVEAMDHWMYAVRDEAHQEINASAIEAALSDEALKSKVYYQLHEIISFLPEMLKVYKSILTRRNEKAPEQQCLESISQDATSMYHNLSDGIFLTDADKAYA